MPAPVLVMVDRPTDDWPRPEDALRVADPAAPQLTVTDLGVNRGDGIFETVGVTRGRGHAVDAHLHRFARSAALMDLPSPNLDLYRAAVRRAVELLGDVPEAYCKYVMTRGAEGTARPTGWAYATASPDWSRERTSGIRVVTLSRGYQLDVAEVAPWLLQGAKTLSYAVNRSALREAARRGADDALFTTTDGYLLEGPTSNVILRLGDSIVTPSPQSGVLPGTTQGNAFVFCEERGLTTQTRHVRVWEVREADALWLTSSTRLAAPVSAVDGRDLPVDRAFTAGLNEFLLRAD